MHLINIQCILLFIIFYFSTGLRAEENRPQSTNCNFTFIQDDIDQLFQNFAEKNSSQVKEKLNHIRKNVPTNFCRDTGTLYDLKNLMDCVVNYWKFCVRKEHTNLMLIFHQFSKGCKCKEI